MTDGVAEIVSTFQAASINRHPDPQRDIAPSTSVDSREPVRLVDPSPPDLDDADIAEDEIPISVLEPQPRRVTMPPLPDLRFEQSYLKSIQNASGWSEVLWITFRDQVRYLHSSGYRLKIFGFKVSFKISLAKFLYS
jgi:hypothetical protein